jgi:hypothetical protein
MAGGRILTTCTPKYGRISKIIAPFGTTLDCDMWRGAFGTRQMAQSMSYADAFRLSTFIFSYTENSIDPHFSKINSRLAPNGYVEHPEFITG